MTAAKEIAADEVRRAIERFWTAFANKTSLEDFYTYAATVFGSMATRVEYGRLAALRREREYFHPETVIETRITSPVEVMIRGEVAIASYTYEFRSSRARIGPERIADEHIRDGRVTQVFARDDDDTLRILHEHVSQADTWTKPVNEPNHATTAKQGAVRTPGE